MRNVIHKLFLLVLGSMLFLTTGCATNTGSGALIGGAGGAALGGLIGSMSHARFGEGALLGGAIGAVAGGVIGDQMDRQEREYGYRDSYQTRPYYPDRPVYRDTYDCPPPPPPPPPPAGYYEYRSYSNSGPCRSTYRETRTYYDY